MPTTTNFMTSGKNRMLNLWADSIIPVLTAFYGETNSSTISLGSEEELSWESASDGKIALEETGGEVVVIPIEEGKDVNNIRLYDSTTSYLLAKWDLMETIAFPHGGDLIITSLEVELANE